MKLRPVLAGAKTYVCGFNAAKNTAGTGPAASARYCYSVWLRHLALAFRYGMTALPEVIAELGPGDTLGVGLAALISGCSKYYALDVVDYAKAGKNPALFEELVELFRARAPIPGQEEFPLLRPLLPSYEFPREALPEAQLARALNGERLSAIREALGALGQKTTMPAGIEIRYYVPWYDAQVLEREAVDLIYSQAVLEHVDDLDNTYRAMRVWLKPGGLVSHQIDFQSHGTAEEWNGHWAYSDLIWKIIRGRRPYLLNRRPQSDHIRCLEENGFRVLCNLPVIDRTGIERRRLARPFQYLSDADLVTSGVYLLAEKK